MKDLLSQLSLFFAVLIFSGSLQANMAVRNIPKEGMSFSMTAANPVRDGGSVDRSVKTNISVNAPASPSAEMLAAYGHINPGDKTVLQFLNVPFDTDHPRQKLDVFRPIDNPKAPMIVMIHGGGWFRGERAWCYQPAIFWVRQGYSVACLGYRRLPDYPDWKTNPAMWENIKHDLMSSLQFLVDNASVFGIDASKAITVGSSAGGHLALCLRAKAEAWKQDGVVDRVPKIIGCIAHCAPCDLTAFKTVYSERIKATASSLSDVDPMNMNPADFEGLLIVHGDADTSVQLSDSIGFITHLQHHKVNAQLAIVPGAGHSFIYEMGLDKVLAPGGVWLQPPQKMCPRYGQMGIDATMVCITGCPGYGLPYTPFFAEPGYYYYGQKSPSTH
ncbi:MAG: hypothetical protein A2Y12_01070 [Planctomycetes bacterium GWF2_42_9]|nr:MAG: hypothetical protein A2Y12_01070 [Planctomycetes bacterium GWF2_42_9]